LYWPRVTVKALVRGMKGGEPACTPDSVRAPERPGRPSLSAGGYPPAPAAYPGSTDGPPSPCLALLRVGFTEPPGSPRALVRSYRTVAPLPVRRPAPVDRPRPWPSAVSFLWHCPAGRPDWVLPSTLPYGVRTFLGPVVPVRGRPAGSPPGSMLPAGRPEQRLSALSGAQAR